VRNAGDDRELTMMRWGMPPPPRTGGPPVTNIRNTSSPHWRGWLKPESRRLVPANSFAEYAPEPNPATVEPIHPKAMSVILTKAEERDVWMRAPQGPPLGTPEALDR
jgi:putative SOS response-associated peptidase YedK